MIDDGVRPISRSKREGVAPLIVYIIIILVFQSIVNISLYLSLSLRFVVSDVDL